MNRKKSEHQSRARGFEDSVAMDGYGLQISFENATRALRAASNAIAPVGGDWCLRTVSALAMAERIDHLRNRGRRLEMKALIEKVKNEMLKMNLSSGQPQDKKGFRLYVQGRLLCSVEEFDFAKKAFLAANRLIPKNEKIAAGMFDCAFATSNVRQAFFWAVRLTELAPKNAQNLLKLAVCWMVKRVGCEARAAIEDAIRLEPENKYFQRFLIESDDSDPDFRPRTKEWSP